MDGLAGQGEVCHFQPKKGSSLTYGSFEPPSNVTRLARGLRRNCSDGTHQIISYFAGVGTANAIDQFTGGAFGMGLDRDIRLVYNFICTNYVDGDEIILVGFSRGAFTARSTADMVASVGLLTPEGLDHFYRIFDDYEHIGDLSRDVDDYLVKGLPLFEEGLHGQDKIKWELKRMAYYKEGLKKVGAHYEPSTIKMYLPRTEKPYSGHVQRRHHRDQNQGSRCLGHGRDLGHSPGARHWRPRFR